MKRIIVDFVRRLVGISLLSEKLDEKSREIDAKLRLLVTAQRFRLAMEDCEWLKYRGFAPGGWAMDNLGLYTLFRILNHMRPKNILEFGLGQSSLMIHQYATFYKNINALTIEHDQEWIAFWGAGISKDIKYQIKQCDKEFIEYKGFKTLTYKNFKEIQELKNERYDFFVVDGPFGSEHYSRSQIIEIVNNNLPEEFCILIDDSERNGEKETIAEIRGILTAKTIEHHAADYCGEKSGHTVICSKNLRFLTSL